MKKIKAFLTKYHVMFFITLIMSIYFLVTEILNFIENKSAISMFTIILYISSITYISLMEYFDWKKKDPRYSYQFTFYYLLVNAIMLPLTVLFGNISKDLSPIYSVASYFQSELVLKIMLLVYILYLLFKFIKPIVKARKAKRENDHYARCGNFGDVISGLLTLITSFFGVFTLNMNEFMVMSLLSIRTVPFMVSAIVVWAVTIIFTIKIGLGIRKIKKELKD